MRDSPLRPGMVEVVGLAVGVNVFSALSALFIHYIAPSIDAFLPLGHGDAGAIRGVLDNLFSERINLFALIVTLVVIAVLILEHFRVWGRMKRREVTEEARLSVARKRLWQLTWLCVLSASFAVACWWWGFATLRAVE